MAITKIRGPTSAGGTNGATATFSGTPAPGNLLIAAVFSNTTTAASASISGWTQAQHAIHSTTGTPEIALFYRVAGAGEPTPVPLVWTGGGTCQLSIEEWTQSTGGAWALDQIAATNNTGSGVTSRSSGTTPITTYPDELAIAVFGTANTVTAQSYSNGFTEEQDISAATRRSTPARCSPHPGRSRAP